MQVQEFPIKGLKLIKPKVFKDERGFFTERFKLNEAKELGLPDFVQDNFSRSAPGVLRGLHYQFDKPQSKLVTALSGRIFDVAVDIRKGSPTFGKHESVILDGNEPAWFWIPAGFAHGFCVIGDEPADLLYKVDHYWSPKGESGILWNDPELKIQWPPTKNEVLAQRNLVNTNSLLSISPKDQILQSFAYYVTKPVF